MELYTHPSRHHSYISHITKLPDVILNLKFVQNLQNFVTERSSQLPTRTSLSPQLQGNCYIPPGSEMHIESPYSILDSALLTCIHVRVPLVSFKTRIQRKKPTQVNLLTQSLTSILYCTYIFALIKEILKHVFYSKRKYQQCIKDEGAIFLLFFFSPELTSC